MLTLDTAKMKYKAKQKKDNVETYDYSADFLILSGAEKRVILKTAKILLKQQKQNTALLAYIPVRQEEKNCLG
jgi:hypothetical protein